MTRYLKEDVWNFPLSSFDKITHPTRHQTFWTAFIGRNNMLQKEKSKITQKIYTQTSFFFWCVIFCAVPLLCNLLFFFVKHEKQRILFIYLTFDRIFPKIAKIESQNTQIYLVTFYAPYLEQQLHLSCRNIARSL